MHGAGICGSESPLKKKKNLPLWEAKTTETQIPALFRDNKEEFGRAWERLFSGSAFCGWKTAVGGTM